MPNHQYPTPVYPSSPPNIGLPLSGSPPPQSPNSYDPLSPPVSGSDTSADGIYISRNSSGTGSPSSSRANSLVHRHPLRYNPTPSPSGSSTGRRGRGRSFDSDDDEPGSMRSVVQEISHSRKEATRKQRIEAEQRRRDELRDGYARLKDVLPVSNQKSSKVSLLERATNYIVQLDKQTRQMQTRLAALEAEVQRLRAINEKISLSVGSTPEALSQPMSIHPEGRSLTPPPESTTHSMSSVNGEQARDDSGGSADESGY
ncbi:hypothetical protein BD410DRAFT_712573 [Rickenella mellea]|uniref:BHLH domain-containing protein n=1 Tax=Rickenella mellea TaxID=50990 RepID=A0A4Y7QKE1_9AGAM|nr:hypothetical protein BD410DRAFT_712573 [Rickenella mellea]